MKKQLITFICLGLTMSRCLAEPEDENIPNYSQETYTVNIGIPYRCSIYKDLSGYDAGTVLYYMHSSDGNEDTWYNSHKEIILEWKKTGKPSPVVVCISFGKRWLLTPGNAVKKKSGYLDFFVQKIIPSTEKQINQRTINRYVMGISMGGINTAQLVFRYPEIFKKAVIISPYIYPVSIYSDKEIINQYIQKENSRVPGIKKWINLNILGRDKLKDSVYDHISNLKRDYFPDKESWDKSDIFINMRHLPKNSKLKIYISCGYADDFGFYPGSEKLALKAISLSYPVIWRTLHGGHMAIDEKEIAAFLLN